MNIETFKSNQERRTELLLSYLIKFINVPYVFGGNSTVDGGLDCSGFVLEGLRSIGLWGTSDASSQQIFTALCGRCQMPEIPSAGDLLFFGQSRQAITHVSICLNESQVIEAGGNNQNGMVRVRPISWRKDLVAVLRFNQ